MLSTEYIEKFNETKETICDIICEHADFSGWGYCVHCEYKDIFSLLIKHVVNNVSTRKFTDDIRVITEGEYQGTLIFYAHTDAIDPTPYDFITGYAYYGSCSGCDALMGATCRDDVMHIITDLFEHMKFLCEI